MSSTFLILRRFFSNLSGTTPGTFLDAMNVTVNVFRFFYTVNAVKSSDSGMSNHTLYVPRCTFRVAT